MALRTVTPPYAEPVSLAQAKEHLRVDGADEDLLIGAWIKAAREYCETFTRRTVVTTGYRLTLDRFPTGSTYRGHYYREDRRSEDAGGGANSRREEWYDRDTIRLWRPPVTGVSSIAYVDANGDTQTLATDRYQVDTETEPARVAPAYANLWPETRDVMNAVTVNFTCGVITPFTVNHATNVLTFKGRTFADGTAVRLSNGGGALPGGLAADTEYFVVEAAGSTAKLSPTAGGAAVDLTSAGTGTHFVGIVPPNVSAAILLLVGHWYENRETVGSFELGPLAFTVDSLLWQDRVF